MKKRPKKVFEKRRNQLVCTLYADPHVQGFNRHYYEAQLVGDWLLYRGDDLSAHYRGKRVGAWVAPIKFGIRLYHTKIYTIGFNLAKLEINGEVRDIPNGKTEVGHGLITRNNNKITFSTKGGEEIDLIAYGYFFNSYVRTNAVKVDGICSQKFVKSFFFGHPQKGKEIKEHEHKLLNECKDRKRFERHCEKIRRFKTKQAKMNCVFDRCAGLNGDVEKEIIRDNNHEKKK